MIKKHIRLWLFSLCLAFNAYSFVQNKSDLGDNIVWPSGQTSIQVWVDPVNNNSISSSDVNSIIDLGLSNWNGNGNISISRNSTSTIQEDRNDIYFSTSPSFGSSVLAVTTLTYYTASGRLIEADIAINDSKDFSADATITNNSSAGGPFYLGDIITHELGHLIGLGHGQVHNSTMFYTVFKGQFSTSSDDKLAVRNTYPIGSYGTITGNIAGSDSIIGVFGAHVHAISAETGEVILSVVTDSGGTFSLKGLPLNDTYFLYISPFGTSASPPDFYSTIEKDFCSSGDWRGAYYTKCGVQYDGFPEGVGLTLSQSFVDLGNLSIACSFDTPLLYTSTASSTNEINLVNSNGSLGQARTGFFLQSSINENNSLTILNNPAQRNSDKYQIDLTDFDIIASGYGASDLYLDVKIVAQGLYSANRINLYAERVGGPSEYFPDSDFDFVEINLDTNHSFANVETSPDIDIIGRIPLDVVNASNNIFNVELIPQPLNRGTSFNNNDFFPSSLSMLDQLNHYMVIFSVSEKDGSEFNMINFKNYQPYADNTSCMQGPNTQSVQPFGVEASSPATPSGDAAQASSESGGVEIKKESLIGLCGTINTDGGSGGSGNLILVLGLSFLLSLSSRRRLTS